MPEINVNNLRDLALAKKIEEQDLYLSHANIILPKLLLAFQEAALLGKFSYTVKPAQVPSFLGAVLPTTKQYECILGKLQEILSISPYEFSVTTFCEFGIEHLIISWK